MSSNFHKHSLTSDYRLNPNTIQGPGRPVLHRDLPVPVGRGCDIQQLVADISHQPGAYLHISTNHIISIKSIPVISTSHQSMLALVLHLLLDMTLTIVVFIDQHSGRHLSRQRHGWTKNLTVQHSNDRIPCSRMGFLEKTSWFLANVTSSICLMVSIFFWTILYPLIDRNTFGNTFLHLLNSVWYVSAENYDNYSTAVAALCVTWLWRGGPWCWPTCCTPSYSASGTWPSASPTGHSGESTPQVNHSVNCHGVLWVDTLPGRY